MRQGAVVIAARDEAWSPRLAMLASLTADPSAIRVREPRREWTAGELMGAAVALRPLLAAGDGPVGVACARPGWLLASLIAAWGARRAPILIDPELKKETETLARLHPGITVLADSPDAGDSKTRDAGRIAIEGALASVAGRPSAVREPPDWFQLPGDDDLFASLFTSGSEGDGKVVQKLGRQMYRQAGAVIEHFGIRRGPRVLSFVPPFHLLGLFYGVVMPLAAEGESRVATDLTGAAMADLVSLCRPDVVIGTATHYRFFVRAPVPSVRPVHARRSLFLSSGAALDPSVAETFASRFGTPVHEIYGATELGGVAGRRWPEPYRAWPGVEWRADPGTLRLEVRSPWAASEREDAWIATEDAVEPVGDGRFRLLGRLGHLVKVGGKRFSSIEVEQAIRSMPGVADAAVVLYERFGEQAIAAVISQEPTANLSEEEVRAFLAARLAPFKLPRTIRFLAQLPRGRLAKLDYAALRRLVAGIDGAG